LKRRVGGGTEAVGTAAAAAPAAVCCCSILFFFLLLSFRVPFPSSVVCLAPCSVHWLSNRPKSDHVNAMDERRNEDETRRRKKKTEGRQRTHARSTAAEAFVHARERGETGGDSRRPGARVGDAGDW
jgi:hypothetical protein